MVIYLFLAIGVVSIALLEGISLLRQAWYLLLHAPAEILERNVEEIYINNEF